MDTLCSLFKHYSRTLALTGVLSAAGLAGCSDTPHDRVDAPAGAKMIPLPPSAPSEKKPAVSAAVAPTEAEIGMPVYPNAKPYAALGEDAAKPSVDSSGTMALLETTDSLDKVLDFYKERMKETDHLGNPTPSTPHETTEAGKRKVVLTGHDAQGNIQMAQLREEDGKTAIELMRTSAKSLPASVGGKMEGK